MTEKNVASAVAYYKAMADKDFSGMARHLHPDVRLVSPMEELWNLRSPLGICGTAVLMSFKEGLIARSELFFARPFIKK